MTMRPLLAAIIGLALATAPAVAETKAVPPPGPASVISIVDGDTAYFLFWGASTKVRVTDLDTPELFPHAKCEAEQLAGERASAFAKQLLPIGKEVELRPKTMGKPDKWGRLLAAIIVDGRDYATIVIERGLGVRYDGRKKPDWCGR